MTQIFFRAVDCGTSGPYNIYPLMSPAVFGFSPDFASSRVVALIAILLQTGAFYPLYLFLLVLPLSDDGLLSSMQYNLVILLAHVLAALFMFALARELHLGRFAAFVSAFCFSAGSFTGRVSWPHMLQSSILVIADFSSNASRTELRRVETAAVPLPL